MQRMPSATIAVLLATSSVLRSFAADSEATNYDSDQIAADYANMKSTNPYFRNDRHTLQTITGDLALRYGNIDIVDFACGDGYYARFFKRLGARRVVGVDLSSDMVALARAAEAKEKLGIEYHNGDCKSLGGLGLGTFHVATASYLLNYIGTQAEMTETMCGIAGTLVPGGRFIGLTINPTAGLPDYRKEWFEQYGIYCYGYPNGGRENVQSGGKVSCDINKMDGTMDPIHLDVFYHSAEIYEKAARECGFTTFEWVPIMAHPDNEDWPKEFFDRVIAIAFVATKASNRTDVAPESLYTYIHTYTASKANEDAGQSEL